MTFGGQTDELTSHQMIQIFLEQNNSHIDTAYAYEDGISEQIIGRYFQNHKDQKAYIATKVNAFPKSGNTLSAESVKRQFERSLKNLQREYVDLLYLHNPDYTVPIEETLKDVDEFHKAGKIKEFGLSNYSAWQVVEICHLCKTNGWVAPTVYQGMYNGITRAVEDELFPALRKYGIRFMAFNPIAGGILSGKYDFDKLPTEGRFAERPLYMERYWKKEIFEGLNGLKRACGEHKIDMAQAAFRWMSCHSLLDAKYGDGIIFGASKMEHFNANMASCANKEPLPEDIIKEFDKAWRLCKADVAPYFKPKPKE